MADVNPFPQEFAINIGGKERRLKYPLPSIFALEDATGVDIINGDQESAKKVSSKNRREMLNYAISMLWAGLIADEPALSRDEVARWVHFRNLEEVQVKTAAAFIAWMPEAPAEGDKPANPQ